MCYVALCSNDARDRFPLRDYKVDLDLKIKVNNNNKMIKEKKIIKIR